MRNYFVDGSNHPTSSANDRMAKGEREGKILAEKLQTGEITLEDGELIKLVGHSHGGAYAIGMAKALLDAGIDPKLIKIFLFAPHQPNQIGGLAGVEIFQMGRDGDDVSSEGAVAQLTGSEHTRIPGADWVKFPDKEDEEYGGHYIHTFTTEEFKKINPILYDYFIKAGYINPDGSVNEN